MIRPAALLLILAAAFYGLAALLMPTPGSAIQSAHTAPAAHAEVHGGTAVSSTLDANRAFFADLFDGAATDLSDEAAARLVATAHRICDLGQPRSEWMRSLVADGPHALTLDEAEKLYDVAQAAYCPQAAQAQLTTVQVQPAAVRWYPGSKTFRPVLPRLVLPRHGWWITERQAIAA